MELSDQISKDFLREDKRIGSVHKVSYGYLIDLITEIKALENIAANWDLLEKLPENFWIKHYAKYQLQEDEIWQVSNSTAHAYNGNTPAEALKAYWDSKGNTTPAK